MSHHHRRWALALTTGITTAGASPEDTTLPVEGATLGAVPSESDLVRPHGVPVTLITGHTAYLMEGGDDGGRGQVVVRGPGGGAADDYYTRTLDGETYVVPVSAFEALSQGRLDPELFNVTSLVDQGYDDLSRDTLPVIVGGAAALTRAAGVSTTAQLESIDAVAASIDKATGRPSPTSSVSAAPSTGRGSPVAPARSSMVRGPASTAEV